MRGINEFVQNLRDVYQSSHDGILITDMEGKIIFLNNSLLHFCNVKEKSLTGKTISSRLSDDKELVKLKSLPEKKAFFSKLKLKIGNGKIAEVPSLVILL